MTPDMRADARAADTEFFRLLATGDAAGLAALLTHDFMLIDVFQGAEIPRSALLELIASGQLRFEPVTPRDVRVRYVEESGTWHLASAQGTMIAPDSPAAE